MRYTHIARFSLQRIFFSRRFLLLPASAFTSDILCTLPRVTSYRTRRPAPPIWRAGRTGPGINKGNNIRAKCPFLCGLARGVNYSKHAPASLQRTRN